MSNMSSTAELQVRRRRHTERGGIEYRLVHAAGFGVFLVAAAVSRLIALIARRPRGADGRRSIIQEARDATSATIPYAFMG